MTIHDSDAGPPGGAAAPPAAVHTITAATHGRHLVAPGPEAS